MQKRVPRAASDFVGDQGQHMTSLTSLESILDPSAATTAVAPAPTVPATEPAPTEPPAPETAVTAEPETPAPELAEGATDPETGEGVPQAAPAAAPAAAPRVPKVPTKQDAPPASNADDMPRDVKGLRAANKAEREKRKAAETREQEILDRLAATETQLREADGQRRQLAAYLQGAKEFAPPGQPQQQQPQIPDAVTHPEERLAFERAQFAQALQQQGQQLAQSMHQQVYATRVLLGQDLMRARHADYDELEAIATREAERTPELREAILRHPNPAQYTYEVGRNIKRTIEVQQAGGWDAYYAQTLKAHVDAEVARQLGTQQPQAATPAAQLATRAAPAAPGTPAVPAARAPAAPPPQSLARVASATPGNRPQAWNGPASLEDILKPIGT